MTSTRSLRRSLSGPELTFTNTLPQEPGETNLCHHHRGLHVLPPRRTHRQHKQTEQRETEDTGRRRTQNSSSTRRHARLQTPHRRKNGANKELLGAACASMLRELTKRRENSQECLGFVRDKMTTTLEEAILKPPQPSQTLDLKADDQI
ncbi:hypothetical protein Bca101_068524 [Brassica carinata]